MTATVVVAAASLAHARCGLGGSAIALETAAPGVWWVPAQRGEPDADNRGQVSNLLVVRAGRRVWLLGSGPSPAFGRALDCRVRAVVGHPVTDFVSPWAQPPLVLGARAFPRARHWVHADVAHALRRRCPDCVQRWREQLGAAAVDLGRLPLRMPGRHMHRVQGAQGRLGPFDWWLVMRANGVPVTLWRVRGTPVLSAHGLLWADALPELRGSDVMHISAATLRLREIAAAATAPQLIGEQGPPAGLAQIDAHLHYWRELAGAIAAAQAAGADGTQAQALPGIEPALLRSPVHTLNWQRAWRQAEDATFAPAVIRVPTGSALRYAPLGRPGGLMPVAPAQGRGRFQRNLR